jgi:hypothetical protein
MKKGLTKKQSLGFLYGFKETESCTNENGEMSISISFKQGWSCSFPKKYKDCNDFYAQEIFVGDYSELFYNPDEFKRVFEYELNDSIEYHAEYYSDIFEKRKFYFTYAITKIQYLVLNAFNQAYLHMNCTERWESDFVKEQVLTEIVRPYFEDDSRSILEICQEFEQICADIYAAEIASAFR